MDSPAGLSGCRIHAFPMYIAITQNIVNIVSQPMLCLLAGHESGRSGNRNLNCPVCRFLHGHICYTCATIVRLRKRIVWKEIIQEQGTYRFFQVNRDIFFPYPLPGCSHHVFHLCRSRPRRNCISRKHLAHATIHSVFLHHGRICLCR